MMATVTGTCEIVESKEEDLDSDQRSKGTDIQSGDLRVNDKAGKRHMPKYLHNSSLEDDLNQLFQGIDLRASGRALRLSHQKDRELSQKNALKKPIKIGAPQASGIGISETVTLKQALRGLCISQKLETAAMKRLSRPSSGLSEAGTIKRLYRAVVVDASEGDLSSNGVKGSMVEISLVPEDDSFNCSKKMPEILQVHKAKELNQIAQSSLRYSITPTTKVQVPPKDEIIPESTETGSEKSNRCPGSVVKPKPAPSSSGSSTGCKVIEADESVPASTKVGSITSMPGLGRRDKFQPVLSSATSSSSSGSKVTKSASTNQRLARPVFRNKNLIRKKVKLDSSSATSTSGTCCKIDNDLGASTSKSVSQIDNYTGSNLRKEPASPASTSTNLSVEVSSNNADTIESSLSCTLNKCSSNRCVGGKANATLRPREKGECSQSSKSSIGEYSSSTSVSEESNLSGSSCCGSRPHMSKDLRWEAIHHVQIQHGSLGFRHFKLLKRLGCGDIGTVYLAELSGTNCVFALKVMDNELLVSRKKMPRAQTEREILQVLDHPFLPTLYAHFTTEKLSCLVMEYCPGGDLHVLRQKQPGRSFPEEAARFYVAEVLLALEYLHMLGVVYRDLKPENILVREDGHIMLSDFDLSLRCTVSPTILRSSSYKMEPEKVQGPCADSSCIDPFCLHPSWVQVSCFSPKLISATAKNRKLKSDVLTQVSPLPQLVAEPTNARSNSFVGTHEYLAPEIIKAEGHGSAVDWWTFGIFMYELLFGKTPFKGRGDEDTLANVVSQGLNFPEGPVVSFQAKDLIRGLLVKEPENRLGSLKGATEIKLHPFFEGLNWALIRCEVPPEIPRFPDLVAPETESYNNSKSVEIGVTEAHLEFNLF